MADRFPVYAAQVWDARHRPSQGYDERSDEGGVEGGVPEVDRTAARRGVGRLAARRGPASPRLQIGRIALFSLWEAAVILGKVGQGFNAMPVCADSCENAEDTESHQVLFLQSGGGKVHFPAIGQKLYIVLTFP